MRAPSLPQYAPTIHQIRLFAKTSFRRASNVYTPAETADKLKVKPVTVIRMCDDGALPGVLLRQGARKRVIRFREEDIEKFLNARASKKATAK